MLVAIDTGGTKTLVAVFDTDGTIVAQQKFPTPADVEAYISTLRETIDSLVASSDISYISAALPGTIVDGVMVWAGNITWESVDISALLSPHYSCPIIVENDANLAGLAEARAREVIPSMLYMTVSTGIGTGIITNGRIDPALSRNEGGRMMLKHGEHYQVWETFASGKAIHEHYGKLASEIDDDTTWRAIASDIAQGMLAICPLLRPDIVVIGGGVGTYFDRFAPYLLNELEENLHDGYMPVVEQAVHPEEAVIYGCYYYAVDTAAA